MEPRRRLRFGALPTPPEVVESPYAKCRDEFKDFDEGEAVAWLVGRPEWGQTIGVTCDVVESARPRKGPRPSYTTRGLEAALFFQVMTGNRTYRAARNELGGDRGHRARVALGFDRPRERRCPSAPALRDGVPSEATMSRHRARFPHEKRVAAYRRYFNLLRVMNARDPEMRQAMRILGIDGSGQLTHLTCPVFDSDTGELVNARRVTCPDGGTAAKNLPAKKQGSGYGLVTLTSIDGMPWAYDHDRITAPENKAGLNALDDFEQHVMPHAGPRELRVLTGDSAYQMTELRKRVRDLGIIENIHEVSHATGRDSTDRERASADRRQLDIQGYPNWYANGHRELRCRCGKAHTFRRTEVNNGRVVARVEAACTACGSITITSGRWRAVRDSRRGRADGHGVYKLVRMHPGDPESQREWAFGNPLTYNDPIAELYGRKRFGHGEGFHGAAATRFALLKTKGYYRSRAQAEAHALMVFCAMHGLAALRRELRGAHDAASGARSSPPLRAAA